MPCVLDHSAFRFSMERSSPLAAMQPPSMMGAWGFQNNVLGSRHHCSGPAFVAPSSFDFKDLTMKKSSSDYFSIKSVRGSSPTASLAADLSQNFHIDQRYAPVAHVHQHC